MGNWFGAGRRGDQQDCWCCSPKGPGPGPGPNEDCCCEVVASVTVSMKSGDYVLPYDEDSQSTPELCRYTATFPVACDCLGNPATQMRITWSAFIDVTCRSKLLVEFLTTACTFDSLEINEPAGSTCDQPAREYEYFGTVSGSSECLNDNFNFEDQFNQRRYFATVATPPEPTP